MILHSVIAATFAASFVEFVEALTIVLAVGVTSGWRPALLGAVGGALVLGVAVWLAAPLVIRIPIRPLQVVVGAALLLFGLRWLRKAVLRSAGALSFHDEDRIYARELERHPRPPFEAIAASFNAVLVEGVEVVFIVIAAGAATGAIAPAAFGAALAGLVVVLLGLAVRKPLARVPENALKLCVAIVLCGFGLFWLGEGAGIAWPAGDLTPAILIALFSAVACGAIAIVRRRIGVQTKVNGARGISR